VLPSPEQAALAAAQIVSQIVDIESESGAVIAAAAAAGAAIEAAVAAQKAIADPQMPPGEPIDAVTTAKLSRERILRALGEEPPVRARSEPPVPVEGRAETGPPFARPASDAAGRATTADSDDAEEFDPVAIAAAAIARLRARARTPCLRG